MMKLRDDSIHYEKKINETSQSIYFYFVFSVMNASSMTYVIIILLKVIKRWYIYMTTVSWVQFDDLKLCRPRKRFHMHIHTYFTHVCFHLSVYYIFHNLLSLSLTSQSFTIWQLIVFWFDFKIKILNISVNFYNRLN